MRGQRDIVGALHTFVRQTKTKKPWKCQVLTTICVTHTHTQFLKVSYSAVLISTSQI